MNLININNSYEAAKELFAAYGINTDDVLKKMDTIQISMHCWQGDDVTGLEQDAGGTSGGIMATGNYPGKARTGEELRADLETAMSLLPGKQRVNVHASYAELGSEKIDRDRYETRHFRKWIEWAVDNGIGLDFNPSCFGHPMAADNLTLSNPDEKIRRFWINHVKASRRIAADMGRACGSPCITNIWIPDGMKDLTPNRLLYRSILKDSLDEILQEKMDPNLYKEGLECKLFGIGSESYVVGSHEFYMGYAGHAKAKGNEDLMLTLDMGHFHPTETIADKISSLLLFNRELLVHVSRGVRWDSDHVVISNEDVQEVVREIKRADAFGRVHLALDFFDASINRISAWVIGTRATQKAILGALLEPTELLRKAEAEGNFADRLAMMDEFRNLPAGAVWNKYCLDNQVPAGTDWLEAVHAYEEAVLSKRV
ncbi:MAG: L-rhamnose isomerase [Saccharofermentanales bacterium]